MQPMSSVRVFQIAPESTDRATITSPSLTVTGDLPMREFRDLYGNRCHRLVLPTGVTTVEYTAQAVVPDQLDLWDEEIPETEPADLPDDVLVYTLASRFCQPDVLGGQVWKRFGAMQPGFSRVRAVMDFANHWLTYTTGSTSSTDDSVRTFATGLGVCRDFAHLMITFCRALNIPARYVHGMLPDMDVPPVPTPMDFHAWVQVWLDGRWIDVDPRWNAPRKGRVPISYGRDAADVAIVTTFGAPWLQYMGVTCEEAPAAV